MADIIETETFTTPSSEYMKRAASLWLSRWYWALALPLLVSAALAVIDLRFIFVTLMLVFIILPVVFLNLTFFYLLTPEARRAVLPKRITFVRGKGMEIIYEKTESHSRVPASENIPAHMISAIKPGSKAYTLIINTKPRSFIIVPYEVLKVSPREIGELEKFM